MINLTDLQRVSDHEVCEWLEEKLQLTPYQKQILIEREIVRFAPFYFYKWRNDKKVSLLWRLTIVIYPIYWLILFIGLPFKWIVTGKWGYGRKFFDNFHAKWVQKLGI
jgi:hypothetical protein